MAPKIDWLKRFNDQDEKVDNLVAQNTELISLLKQVLQENKELKTRVVELEKRVAVAADVDEVVVVDDPTKKNIDLLILSDSIYRHVGVSVPKEAIDRSADPAPIYREFDICSNRVHCLKIVIPGAKAPRLLAEAQKVAANYTFGEIILHCGANHIPHDEPSADAADVIVTELYNLHLSVRDLFPHSVITFSQLLPMTQVSRRHRQLICEVNMRMDSFCQRFKFCILRPHAFAHAPVKYICRDGVHLSFAGVEAITRVIEQHITDNFLLKPFFKTRK